jgi:hypothetical protein
MLKPCIVSHNAMRWCSGCGVGSGRYEPVADPAALGVRSEALISFYTMLDEHAVPENANGPVQAGGPSKLASGLKLTGRVVVMLFFCAG